MVGHKLSRRRRRAEVISRTAVRLHEHVDVFIEIGDDVTDVVFDPNGSKTDDTVFSDCRNLTRIKPPLQE
jgi:hypothetical protein